MQEQISTDVAFHVGHQIYERVRRQVEDVLLVERNAFQSLPDHRVD